MIYGYATLNGATTGGYGGPEVTVTTSAELAAALADNDPKTVKVSGTLTGPGSIESGSNKTIIGVPGGALLDGVGLSVYEQSNVIIKNLKIKEVLNTADNDAIRIKYSTNVWVDHCELSANLLHPENWEYYDGLLDSSRESDFVTVSWTKFSSNFKGSGIGGESDFRLNKNHITFHHNLFYNIVERAPSLGLATGHLFNNYIYCDPGIPQTAAVMSRFESVVLAENNYFENLNGAIRTQAELPHGFIGDLTSNIFKKCNSPYVSTAKVNWFPPYEYRSIMLRAEDVPAAVLAGAGVQ